MLFVIVVGAVAFVLGIVVGIWAACLGQSAAIADEEAERAMARSHMARRPQL